MLHKVHGRQDNIGIVIIMEMIQQAGLSTKEQEMWRVSLSRANRHQLSDIYQSVKAQPSSIKILTEEMMKVSKKQG